MKVAIAGGHGKIGMRLARLLAADGHEVLSMIRNPDHSNEIREVGAEPVVCDLESADPGEVATAIEAADAVVFAAGAGPGSGPERKQTMDYGGAVKLIAAAKSAGTNRYVIVSSMGADPDASGDDDFSVYLAAKGKADAELAESGLDHTIVRPGLLTDEPGMGTIEAARSVGRGEVSRDDVAATLAACLRLDSTIGESFEMIAGGSPIELALTRLSA